MNIVFLDIDGVLQPYDSENHFYEINNKTKELVRLLSEKHNNFQKGDRFERSVIG